MSVAHSNICNILLDSGAFSFWRRGIDIPISDYIGYCKRHAHEVDAYVNLDCIPGENGLMDHSQAAIEKSASKSYENLQIMKAEGLSPIPVFHQGERFEWLDKMLKDGETYVGISPYLRSHQSEIVEWMDKCFTRITDQQGKPLIKTHGFGVTASLLCRRYPWFSVDSTSWSIGGGYGSILVPRYHSGKPDYTQPPLTIRISARKMDQSRGFDGLSEAHQEFIREYASECDVPMSSLRNTFIGRWKFNVRYHLGMAATCDGRVFKNRLRGMFDQSYTDQEGYQPEPLRMYFATVLHTKHHNVFLNEQGIRNRLLSFAFLKDMPDDFLSYYLETGMPVETTPRPRKMTLRTLSSETYRVRRVQAILARVKREIPADAMD